MAENKESLRALKIKTGVLTRVKKELAMYEKEVVTEGAKLEKMKAEGADAHDVKQQDQVLGESKMMITDCETRLENAFNDLLEAVVRATTRRSTRRPRATPRPAPPRPAPFFKSRARVASAGCPPVIPPRPPRAAHLRNTPTPPAQDEHAAACEGSEELAAAKTLLDDVESLV